MITTRYLSIRFAAATLAFVSLSTPFSVAADNSIGETGILIPEQSGFLRLNPGQKVSLHVAAGLVESCDPNRCAVFVGEEVFGRSDIDVLNDIGLIYSAFYHVEVLDEDFSMDREHFGNFKAAWASDPSIFLVMVEDFMLHMCANSNVDELGKMPVLLGPPQVELLDQSREEESYIRFSALGRMIHMLPHGDTREDTLSVVAGAMNVKSKLVMTTIYGAEANLVWAQEFFDSLASETLELNIIE